MSRWWRAYDEAVDDPKLQRLGPALGWAWFNLMCIASKNGGVLPSIGDLAFKLRTTEQKAAATLTALVTAGLFERIDDGSFAPHNWEGRQFQSDVSNDRVKRYRERKRNVTPTVTVTPPETETDTKTETDTEKTSLRSERRRAARLPADAVPSDRNRADARKIGLSEAEIDQQWRRMRDWSASAKNGACIDWDARWRNWCETFVEGRSRGSPGKSRQSFTEIANELEQQNGHEPAYGPSFDLGDGPVIDAEPISRSRN